MAYRRQNVSSPETNCRQRVSSPPWTYRYQRRIVAQNVSPPETYRRKRHIAAMNVFSPETYGRQGRIAARKYGRYERIVARDICIVAQNVSSPETYRRHALLKVNLSSR